VGSVFSPYYARALRRGPAAAEDHCAINVALYGRGARRWTMTERSSAHVQRSAREFGVGPSRLHWTGDALVIEIDELSLPLMQRVKGRVTVHPGALCTYSAALDADGRHRWGPIAPTARVRAEFDAPDLRWSGHGYLDSNEGDEPIHRPFQDWDWSRASLRDGSTAVIYDVRPKQGEDRLLALRFGAQGGVEPFEAPPRQRLPRTGWRIDRSMRTEPGHPARVQQTLEDAPFYTRSVVASGLFGEPVVSMHETLNVPRLTSTAVQWMLPFKMPRVR
jgi:carotenoid 1,2-hydratase